MALSAGRNNTMKTKRTIVMAAAVMAMSLATIGAASAHDTATCDNLFGEVHGYHILADYVTGIGSELLEGPGLDWPPTEYNAAGGAALPGGPGPAFHFVNEVAPGASFCTGGAQSGVIYTNPGQGRPQNS
jgi:hypothetical protein